MQTHFADFVKKYSSASSHSYLSEIAFVSACIGAARPLALVHRRRKIHRRLTKCSPLWRTHLMRIPTILPITMFKFRLPCREDSKEQESPDEPPISRPLKSFSSPSLQNRD